jgi:cob(I)alamin adenosyltransferase
MKIYTRTGDDGTTGLLGGSRVAKHDARLDAYGTVDELNAVLGLAAVTAEAELRQLLGPVQETLFVIGSHLAAPADNAAAQKVLPPLDPNGVARLEAQIDAAEAELPKLTTFILPGGTETAARLHVARTVCRRAERQVIAFAGHAAYSPVTAYLNRLSDWLFVQARLANHRAGVADVKWVPER